MASIIADVAHVAHSAVATMLSAAQIKVGEQIPLKPVKEDAPEKSIELDLLGKNIILGVPGAFTPTCSSQVPQYIADYERYKEKGVDNIYVVSVNDVFVTKAWKKALSPEGTAVRFIADDKAEFTSSLGLIFDATPVLGGPRSKRYVIVAKNGVVESIAVEENAGMVESTASNKLFSQL